MDTPDRSPHRAPVPRAYRVAAALARVPVRAMTRPRWSGLEHLPEGPYLAVANHVSTIDSLTALHFFVAQGQFPVALAKSSLFEARGFGWLLRACGYVPVYRDTGNAAASIDAAAERLRSGTSVLMFPEGTLTRDPDLWPMAARTGAARLALETGVPVVPVAQWGAHLLMPPPTYRLHPWRRPRTHVRAGEPVELSRFREQPISGEVLRAATTAIMAEVTALLATIRPGTPPEEPVQWRPDPGQGYRR
ncbi:lysophospholipid acyltransferase family protein [Ruania halotolerans]|uniref:lysophospholipid acyltransferase family protein n=1 Tax=Ruania halotolerans TaxID=2897773 RepID=UPI001E4DE447|nr:lysophospholipid acyltransferase family protein [Ruania halotolerans]UFU07825.1 1-acyl-sn-glycerol-3-phosphate acyltransferase [Ruania halotolerans]